MSAPSDAPGEPGPRGEWFEDWTLGRVVVSPARTVTETDVVSFAGLSGDYNPLHVDEEHARRTPFRARVAHGLLVESIASGLAHSTGVFDGTISALAEITIRFVRPTFLGDTVRLKLEVTDLETNPRPKRGRVTFSTVVTKQTGETVLEGTWTVVFLRRPAATPAATNHEGTT